RTLAVGVFLPGSKPPYPCAIDLWDLAGHRFLRRLAANTGLISPPASSPAGRVLARATGMISSLAFNPDRPLLARASLGAPARLWDVATGGQRAVLGRLRGPIQSVVFSPDGSRLAAAGNGIVRVWGVPRGNREFSLASKVPSPRLIAFSAGGQYLDVGDNTTDINVWKLATAGLARPPIRLQRP